MQWSSPQQMQMKMENCLSTISAIINDQPVTILIETLVFCYQSGGIKQVSHKLFIFRGQILDSGQMFFRDQQQMHGSLGLDIMKNQQMFILMNNPGRAFVSNNPAKNTILHSVYKDASFYGFTFILDRLSLNVVHYSMQTGRNILNSGKS